MRPDYSFVFLLSLFVRLRKNPGMEYGPFNADQFKRQLMNYTEAELIKLGRSCSSAESRWLDPMTQ